MKKLLVFTDLHIVPQGETIIGLDPLARFSDGLDHALSRHPDAERIIITGDLTHSGTSIEYMRLHQVLAECPIPIHMTLGNHDRRAAFRVAFPDAPIINGGFVQDVVDLDNTRLILLDTLDEAAPDLHSGYLCADRLDWMDQAISSAGDRRVMVFLHHPPILTGFPGMDSIGLRNRTELATRLSAHKAVVQIIAGHIHRTIHGSLTLTQERQIPVAMLKSPCHQMPMNLKTDDHHLSIDEPGAYGIVLSTDDGIVVHSEDFTLSA